MKKLEWWGYVHINGRIQVKRFFGQRDIDEANESDFVVRTAGPFMATDRADAFRIMEDK